jgi:hypothetical protein
MLKYINNKNCKNDNPNEFDLPKCTKSLLDNIKDNTNFLVRSRCIFMTFKEYSNKIHINNNIYSRIWSSVNEKEIKNTIRIELANIKNNLLRPSTLSIPLPIYAMMAKRLEENVFKGNYELILYIPNLYNYNGNEREYTLFPSLDAFSKQNRWMELMTSKYSKYLQIIKIGMLKDKEKTIIKKNYFRNDLTNTCLNLGCVSSIRDSVYIPEYTRDEQSLTIAADGVPYYPKSCLRTPYYNNHMMNFKPDDTKYNSRDPNIFTDSANIITHCSVENVKSDIKDGFDKYLCDTIIKEKLCEKDEEGSYSTKPLAQSVCNNADKGRAESLLANFYRENLNPGTKDNEYSEDYSINILKELAFRKSKFPGPNDVQEIVFSIFLIDTQFFDENLFCYMPWGNKLLIQDYVLNEGDSLEVDRVSFKSFNDVYEIKFQPDGYLYLYENKKIKMLIPNQSGNLKCFTKKVLKFENMTLNIYGYDTHNNYDLRGYVKLNIKSMYTAPASIILSNSGEIIIYDLGINNRTN